MLEGLARFVVRRRAVLHAIALLADVSIFSPNLTTGLGLGLATVAPRC